MPTVTDPGAADDGDAAVVRVVAELGFSRVQGHPDQHRHVARPPLRGQHPLGLQRRRDGRAVDAFGGELGLDRPSGAAPAAQGGDAGFRIAGIVDEAASEAFRHHLVDHLMKLGRIFAAQSAGGAPR